MKQAISFPPNISELKTAKHTYKVSTTIAPVRYKEYEKLVPSLTFGLKWQEVFQKLGHLWAHLNNQKFADAAVICHNIMNGIKQVDDENRIHPAVEMCALVINREDEDATVYNRELMLEKIADWQEEGFDMQSFFRFALNSIEGFREELISYTKESLHHLQQDLKNT